MTFDELKAEILSRVKEQELCAAYQKALIAVDYDELIEAAATMVEGVNTPFVEWVYLSGVVDETLFAEFPEVTLNAHGIYINNATLTNPCGTCDDIATGLRFGFPGEDDVAGEDRSFDADGNQFEINNASDIVFGGWGIGAHLGTLAYLTGFDASGNLIEVDASAFGADTNFAEDDLTVTANRSHGFSTFKMTFSGTYSSNSIDGMLNVTNTNATSNLNVGIFASVAGSNASSAALYGNGSGATQGVQGSSSSGNGVFAKSTSGNGLNALSTSGTGANIQSNTGTPITASNFSASGVNGISTMLQLARDKSGSAVNGIGGSIDYATKASDGFSYTSNRLISKWTEVTLGSRISQFIITGVDAAVTADLFTLSGSGGLKLNKYGAGTFDDTYTRLLGAKADGTIVEVDPSGLGGGGGGYTPPYKSLVVYIEQSGTSAPTATVLENTVGGSVSCLRFTSPITYYRLSLSGLSLGEGFIVDKTIIGGIGGMDWDGDAIPVIPIHDGGTLIGYFEIYRTGVSGLDFAIIPPSGGGSIEMSTAVGAQKIPIEIKVYN